MPSRNMELLQSLIGGPNFNNERKTAGFEKTMADAFAVDIEVHHPPCFPHGGVHTGVEALFEARRKWHSVWDHDVEVLNVWESTDDEVIVMNQMTRWTAKTTGRSVDVPLIEVLSFRDGQIAKIEIFPQDTTAIMETLEDGSSIH